MTAEEVEAKIKSVGFIHGNVASDAPFGLIDPRQPGCDSVPLIPATLARRLIESGKVSPGATQGQEIKYTWRPDASEGAPK